VVTPAGAARLYRPGRQASSAHPRGKPGLSTFENGCGRETDCLLERAGFEPSVPLSVLTVSRPPLGWVTGRPAPIAAAIVSSIRKTRLAPALSASSLARLRQQQGRPQEAVALLASILGWFTEGFDTADLKEAKALLDNLTEPAIAAEG
jgi:hypothetical protein